MRERIRSQKATLQEHYRDVQALLQSQLTLFRDFCNNPVGKCLGDRIAASQRLLIALRTGQRGCWNPRSNAIRQLGLNECTVLVMLPLPFANPFP